MRLSNKSTFSLAFVFLLIVGIAFVGTPLMAHEPTAPETFAQAHDGLAADGTALTGADLTAETGHSHHATAPMVSSITAEDTMGAVTAGGDLVSNVQGMKIVLVNDADADDTTRVVIALADGDSDPATPDTLVAGEFVLKITFDQDVYTAAGTDADTAPTFAIGDLGTADITIAAAPANVPTRNIRSIFTVGTVARVDSTPTDTTDQDTSLSKTEFLVTIQVAAGITADQTPVSIWVNVAAGQVFTPTQLINGRVVLGRGNAEYMTPNPFSLDGYSETFIVPPEVPPVLPPPDPSETDRPTVMVAAPARVTTPGSTDNLNFTLTFNERISELLESHLMIEGGTFVSATSTDNVVWTVAVDPTGDPAETEVTVTLRGGSVADLEGNLFMSPTDGSDMARYDTVNPTVNAVAGGPAAPVAAGPVTLQITFSEPLGTGDAAFTNTDIDRTSSNVQLTSNDPMKLAPADQPTDGTEVWELTITPRPADAGQVIITIKERSIADTAGNVLQEDAFVTWTRPSVTPPTPDTTKPVVMLQDPKGHDSGSDTEGPADDIVIDDAGGSITFTISDDTALAAGAAVAMSEVSVSNGTVVSVSSTHITVDPMIADGANVNTTVTVTVAAGAIADAAGNMSDAVSATYSIGPIFAIPAKTIYVVTKTAGITHDYLSDEPRLHLDESPPTPAADIETRVWSTMPDLEVLFSFAAGGNGGTINLIEANRQGELGQSRDGGNGQHQSVRISEVMWASDLSMRGAVNDEEAAEQWIEITNNTGSAVRVILYARTGLDSAVNIDDNAEDRVGNAYNGGRGSAGWNVPGQNGNSYTGVNFVSMHRKWDGAHNRGYVNGTSSGNWSASDREYRTVATRNPNDGALYDYVGSPGRPHSIGLPKPSTRAGTTNAPSSPVIINEVANRSDSVRQYEWIELRNVTDNEVNLRNWMISVVRATDDDKPMIQFPNNDHAKIAPQGVILLLASDPRYDDDHPIAVGLNVDIRHPSDQVDGLGLIVDGSNRQPPKQKVINFENGGLPDDGNFVLILRKHDNYEGHRSGQHGGKGVAETGGQDIDKIIDFAGHHEGLNKSNYPGTNPAGLNSTTLWPLVNFSGHNRPHRGHGDWNHRRHNRLGLNRVRYRQHVKTSARNDADGSDGVNRAGTGVTHKNEDVGHYAFRDAPYTGLGYKRTARITGVHNGSPGYHGNTIHLGVIKDTAANAKVTISEIMASTGPDADNPVLPQWIELYNSSPTDPVSLQNWKLRFEMLDANGDPMDSLMNLDLNKGRVKTIPPQQTVLIVAGNASQANSDAAAGTNVFNENRVFNVFRDYGGANKFGANTRYWFFNAKAFHMALVDKNGAVVDAVGNLDGEVRTSETNKWDFPVGTAPDGNRTSFIRIYDDGVAREGVNLAESNVQPVMGTGDKKMKGGDGIDAKYSFVPAVNTEREFKITIKSTWYGLEDDYGTPNNRPGMVLPVELSYFRPTLEDGKVTVRWTTESELDNAGFNILRSETRNGEYKQVNTEMIQGAGTTGERTTYSWVDTTAKPGVAYYYQIEDVSFAGERQALAINRLKGLISAKNKATLRWGELKSQD